MSRPRVIIEVTPTRLEVAVLHRHSIVASRTAFHDGYIHWNDTWADAIESLKPVLFGIVQNLGIQNASATLISRTPSSACTVHSCITSVGRSAAESAAMLALGNVVSYSLDDNPTGLHELARDRGKNPQRHTIAIADSDEFSRVLIDLVESAGLSAESIIPSEAIMMIAAVREAAAQTRKSGVSAVLWMGEESSILATMDAERLRFVRAVSLGTESIVEALTRPITLRENGAQNLSLSRESARQLLQTVGIPERESIVDSATGLTGAAVLPLLQPVLQRLSIEIKQSMRFGLGDADRSSLQLVVRGSGSLIPGLESLLVLQALPHGLDSNPGLRSKAPTPVQEYQSSLHGQIRALVDHGAGSINLIPAHLAERRQYGSLRRALHVGLVLCGIIVSVEGTMTWMELQRLADAHATTASSESASPTDREQLEQAIISSDLLSTRMVENLKPSPAWGPMVSSLIQAAPDSMKFNAVSIRMEENGATAVIAGQIDNAESSETSAILKEFVQQLSSLPLIAGVQLRQTQRLRTDSVEMQQFEIAAPLVLLPPFGAISPDQADAPLASVPGDDT